MTWLEVAPLITFLGVLVTLIVTIQNSYSMNKFSRETSLIVQTLSSQSQFRMACIDRRLQAHQEAFGLWSAINHASSDDEFDMQHRMASDWWTNNCLYLGPMVQKAFLKAIASARLHRKLPVTSENIAAINAAYADFENFPNILFEAVQFPPLSKIDLNEIRNPPKA